MTGPAPSELTGSFPGVALPHAGLGRDILPAAHATPAYVLSVWGSGDEPAEGAPMRLCRAGSEVPVATHSHGFDTSEFRHDGAVVDPEHSLTRTGLMDERRKAAVGEALWARLTPGDIGTALKPLIGTARIYLDLRSTDLLRYPWELLRCSHQYLFVAPNTRWSLGRPEPTDHFAAGTPPPAEHPLRVMVVTGNRPDDKNIRAEQELLVIEKEAHLRNAEVLLKPLVHPSAAEMASALKEFRPHIFHFIGHGGTDPDEPPQIFVYSSTTRTSDPWDADRIRTVFSEAPPGVVVLNACQTAHTPTEATSLVQAFSDAGCIATVAMMGEIRGTASEAFSAGFYREVFRGAPVDVATTRARLIVKAIADDPSHSNSLELRANWVLPRVSVRGDAASAVVLQHAGRPAASQWLKPDFVARWDERWQAWKAMDGSRKGDHETESRLVVLWGPKDAGKRELLNTLAEIRARTGDIVLYVDLSGARTGRWRDVLNRIADEAARVGFHAAELQAVARSEGSSSTVIPQFLAYLEALRRPGGHGAERLLVVLDGLSDWPTDEVSQTLLPEVCRPFVRAAADSRVRLMIALQEHVDDSAWGARPEGWEPVAIDQFHREEWKRAVQHFRDYWVPRVRAEKQAELHRLAAAMEGAPYGLSLGYMRSLAELMR